MIGVHKKNNALITVAMPVYNGGEWLFKSVQSVIDQSFQDWKLLIIDDGSNDWAVESIKKINDERISIIQDHQNKGIAFRLNQAIELTNTPYFARVDADDINHPQRFEKQINFLIQNPNIDLVGSAIVIINKNNAITGNHRGGLSHKEICKQPWKSFPIAHPTWLGKTAWFKMYKYAAPAPFRCEDQELLLRAHKVSHYHVLIDPLVAYRVTQQKSAKTLFRTRWAMLQFQTRYFLKYRENLNFSAAFLSFLMRMTKDPLKLKSYSNNAIDEKTKIEWASLLKD